MTAVRFGHLNTHAPYLQVTPTQVRTTGRADALGHFLAEGQVPQQGDGAFQVVFYGGNGRVKVTLRDGKLDTPATFEPPSAEDLKTPVKGQAPVVDDPEDKTLLAGLSDKAKAVLQQYALDLHHYFKQQGEA